MGKGFAVGTTDRAVFAPISGTIRQVLPTRHAVGIESEDGVIDAYPRWYQEQLNLKVKDSLVQ